MNAMRRLRRTGATPVSPMASLAPMVDMMTILLVFLLKSYATDPPIHSADPDFRLPTSVAEEVVRRATEIDLTREAIYINGVRTAGTRYYLDHDEDRIREVYDLLLRLPGPILIRADERTPYALIRKLIFTAQEAGVEQVTLVAVSRSSL